MVGIFVVFSVVGAVVGCRCRRLFAGFLESTHEACVSVVLAVVVPAVVWGLLVAGCVVWVNVVCWVLWEAVFIARQISVFTGSSFFTFVWFCLTNTLPGLNLSTIGGCKGVGGVGRCGAYGWASWGLWC